MSKEKAVKSPVIVMTDYLICLIAISVLCIYYYGIRALIVIITAVATSFVCDVVCIKLRGKKLERWDISSVISALVFALLCPATIPYQILIVSCIFMIVIGKQAFGGKDNYIFNCVAVAFVFAALCFKEYMFVYPVPEAYAQLDLSSYVSDNVVKSFTLTIDNMSKSAISNFDMILGKMPGPMGTTNIILIAVCAFVLICRNSISLITFVTSIASILGITFLFPPSVRESAGLSVVYELFSGATLFVATFVVSDKNYVPKTKYGKALYGISAGILAVLFRRFANVEIGLIFAVVLINPLCDFFDNNSVFVRKLFKFLWKVLKRIAKYIKNIFIIIFASLFICVYELFRFIFMGLKFLFKLIFTEQKDNDDKQENTEKQIVKTSNNKKSGSVSSSQINTRKRTVKNKVSDESKKDKIDGQIGFEQIQNHNDDKQEENKVE